MILLDTDHVSVLQVPDSARRTRLTQRMSRATDEIFSVSIVTIEEQMRGWLASIAKERQARRQVKSYRELRRMFSFFMPFHILPFDDPVAERFDHLRSSKIRVATMDLKIASIAIVNNALLLTANRRDFEQVPGLRFDDWID